jgi:hypothetical protein
LRRVIGKDIQIITKGKLFTKLESFFDELFPDFKKENPFENPDYYKFPFKNISVEFLIVVNQMDNRLELLREAEKEKMTYAVFLDYVINQALSINEELGRRKYMIKNPDRNFCFYIINKDLFKGEKGVYLDLIAFELKEKKENKTHLIKQKIPKEIFKALSDEQKGATPILGDVSTWEREEEKPISDLTTLDENDGLPF